MTAAKKVRLGPKAIKALHVEMLGKLDFSKWEEAPANDYEFIERMIHQNFGGWVPFTFWERWSEMTVADCKRLVKLGHWQYGEHFILPLGGPAWVNVHAIRKWMFAPPPEPSPEQAQARFQRKPLPQPDSPQPADPEL